jgi:uncharacterized membrane protein
MKIILAEINIFKSVEQLLKLYHIRFTATALKKKLEHHPDALTVSALSDVLTAYKIPNLATRLTPERLYEVPLPAILHLHKGTGQFAPVRKVAEVVEWYDTELGWQVEPFNDFVHKWSGMALLVEPNEQSGEVNYAQNRQREIINSLRWLFVGFGLALCLGGLLWSMLQTLPFAANMGYYALLATKLIGTALSIMLVWYGIDANNTFLQSVCQLNKTTNCNNILNSPAAKLTSWLSWSEVGLFYFVGGVLVLALGENTQHRMGGPVSLITLNLLALPYTFWSVYYQWRVAKQWCPLCLSVLAILWLEAAIGFWLLPKFEFTFSVSHFSFFILNFSFTPILWAFLKPHLQKSMRFDTVERDLQRLKFDPDYLQGLLSKQRSLPPVFEGMKAIVLGNIQAEHHLILVSNPTCAACRRNHLAVESILRTTDNLSVTVILAANFDHNDEASKVTRQVLSLPTNQMPQALHSWFEKDGQPFKDWAAKVGGNCDEDAAFEQLGLHLRWLELAGVTSTPASFLNSIELPKTYSPYEIPKLCTAFENRETAIMS